MRHPDIQWIILPFRIRWEVDHESNWRGEHKLDLRAMPFSFLWGNICKAIRTMHLMQNSKRFLLYTSYMESYQTGTGLIVQGRNKFKKKKKEIESKWFSSLNCFGIVSIRISISHLWNKLPNQAQNVCIRGSLLPSLGGKNPHRFLFHFLEWKNSNFLKER